MIAMSSDDRDALRFLWVDNPHSDNPNIVIYRFARVVFGVSSSLYLLNSTIQHHLKQYLSQQPNIVEKLLELFYVDDLICGGSDNNEAYNHYMFAKDVLSHASFNLRKFITSSQVLRDKMKQDLRHPMKENHLMHPALTLLHHLIRSINQRSIKYLVCIGTSNLTSLYLTCPQL